MQAQGGRHLPLLRISVRMEGTHCVHRECVYYRSISTGYTVYINRYRYIWVGARDISLDVYEGWFFFKFEKVLAEGAPQ